MLKPFARPLCFFCSKRSAGSSRSTAFAGFNLFKPFNRPNPSCFIKRLEQLERSAALERLEPQSFFQVIMIDDRPAWR